MQDIGQTPPGSDERLIERLEDRAPLYGRTPDSDLIAELEGARQAEHDAQASADTWLAEHKMSEAQAQAAEASLSALRGEVGKLRDAVAAVDQADKACPVNAGRSCPDKCPKCGARDDQNCGPNVTALSALHRAAASLLSTLEGNTVSREIIAGSNSTVATDNPSSTGKEG